MKIWRIQNIAEKGKASGGVVVSPYGIAEDPNAEILAPGLSTSKEYGAVGVARYGNFLYWGYSGTPSQMTDAGKKFFLNSICYIKQFPGKPKIEKTDVKVLYVGRPDSDRAKDFIKLP